MVSTRLLTKSVASAGALPDEGHECGVKLIVGAGFGNDDPLTDGTRCLLDLTQLLGRENSS
jgi:hypothetical protein